VQRRRILGIRKTLFLEVHQYHVCIVRSDLFDALQPWILGDFGSFCRLFVQGQASSFRGFEAKLFGLFQQSDRLCVFVFVRTAYFDGRILAP
jgi:hypothetical protein